MAKLYQLTDEFRAIENMIAENEGEVSEAEIMAMNEIKKDFENKAESIAKMIQNLKGEYSAVKAEAKRLACRAKSLDNNIERWKKYIKGEMTAIGVKKIEGETLSLTLKNIRDTVDVIDENQVPDSFKEKIVVFRVDRKSCLEAYKSGVPVPGIKVLENNKSLTIR